MVSITLLELEGGVVARVRGSVPPGRGARALSEILLSRRGHSRKKNQCFSLLEKKKESVHNAPHFSVYFRECQLFPVSMCQFPNGEPASMGVSEWCSASGSILVRSLRQERRLPRFGARLYATVSLLMLIG